MASTSTTPESIVTKRIHIGGLTPNITTQHISERFKSFGTVTQVEELGKDALGDPRPFTFFTIETSPAQLKKCLNIMSGSTWRGSQLRLAEAKPRYDIRIEKENNPTMEETELRLRKKRRRVMVHRGEGVGKEAQDMRVPTARNIAQKRFWTTAPPPDSRMIRPLALRPTHPLIPKITHTPLTAEKEGSTSQTKRKRRDPPSRNWRRVVNPLLWDPTHLDESAFSIPHSGSDERQEWEWESASATPSEDEEEGRTTRILGRWRRAGGEEIQEVRVQRRNPQLSSDVDFAGEDNVDDILEGTQGREGGSRSASPLFAGRRAARSASPLFPIHTDTNTDQDLDMGVKYDLRSRSSSPLFASRPADMDTGTIEEDHVSLSSSRSPASSPDDTRSASGSSSRAPSPLFPRRSASPPSIIPTVASAAKTKTNIPLEILSTLKAERSRDLSLLSSLLGDELHAEPITRGPGPQSRSEWGGFAEESDTDLEEEEVTRLRGGGYSGVLQAENSCRSMEEITSVFRLRGGGISSAPGTAPGSDSSDEDTSSEDEADKKGKGKGKAEIATSSSSGSESDSDSDSDSSSSTDSDSDDSEESVPEDVPEINLANIEPAAAPKSSLKDMFAASSAAQPPTSFSLLQTLDPEMEMEEMDIPFAPAVPGEGQGQAELEPLVAKASQSHFDPDPSLPLFFPQRGFFAQTQAKDADGEAGFWAQETDDEMEEIWEAERGDLTQGWKKRFREAKKAAKRRGGAGVGDDE